MNVARVQRCRACGETKVLTEFYRNRSRRAGHDITCKDCRRKEERDRRASDPVRQRDLLLRSKYGITLAEYDWLVEQQEGRCAICLVDAPGRGSDIWHVDHDHDTGEVRGLLCNRCNPGLGFFQDDPDRLELAARYLRTGGVSFPDRLF